jgi:hypothetical protein
VWEGNKPASFFFGAAAGAGAGGGAGPVGSTDGSLEASREATRALRRVGALVVMVFLTMVAVLLCYA